jgi:hypothetical protein
MHAIKYLHPGHTFVPASVKACGQYHQVYVLRSYLERCYLGALCRCHPGLAPGSFSLGTGSSCKLLLAKVAKRQVLPGAAKPFLGCAFDSGCGAYVCL